MSTGSKFSSTGELYTYAAGIGIWEEVKRKQPLSLSLTHTNRDSHFSVSEHSKGEKK